MKARKTPIERVDIVIQWNIGAFKDMYNQMKGNTEAIGYALCDMIKKHME